MFLRYSVSIIIFFLAINFAKCDTIDTKSGGSAPSGSPPSSSQSASAPSSGGQGGSQGSSSQKTSTSSSSSSSSSGQTLKGSEVSVKGTYDQTLPVPIDRRMRTLVYSPNDVYKLKFKVGYNSQIVFPLGESPILQTFGDARGWTVKLVGNALYMKPMDPGLQTNMIITTNKDRTYYFDVMSTHTEDFEDDDFFYRLSFYYPDIAVDGPILTKQKGKINEEIKMPTEKRKFANIANLNFQYSFSGGGSNAKPIKVFDDGNQTYLMFANNNEKIPLIYAVDPDGSEHLLRYKMNDGYVVLDTTEYQFSLRFGSELICIFNEKFVKVN